MSNKFLVCTPNAYFWCALYVATNTDIITSRPSYVKTGTGLSTLACFCYYSAREGEKKLQSVMSFLVEHC